MLTQLASKQSYKSCTSNLNPPMNLKKQNGIHLQGGITPAAGPQTSIIQTPSDSRSPESEWNLVEINSLTFTLGRL